MEDFVDAVEAGAKRALSALPNAGKKLKQDNDENYGSAPNLLDAVVSLPSDGSTTSPSVERMSPSESLVDLTSDTSSNEASDSDSSPVNPSESVVDLTSDKSSNEASNSDSSPENPTSDQAAPNVRRSSRERTSTTIMVNGIPVLTKNNYVLKGLSYEYGAFETTKPKKPPAKKVAAKPKKPPRKPTSTEVDRMARVQQVRDRVAQKAPARQAYLASHVNALEPFCEPQISAKLRSVTTQPKAPSKVFLQPDLIQAEMRDYQMAGLEWMVNMHKSNLSMILGDEMGLVCTECVHVHVRILFRDFGSPLR